MRVREIMSAPVETVSMTSSLDDAAALMRALRLHHLVVKQGSKIAGLLSAHDIPRPDVPRNGRMVRDVMKLNVATIDQDETVRRAANLMRGRNIGSLVVTRGGKLTGILTVSDLLDLVGKGAGRRIAPARASLHYRVKHQKRHRGRSW